MDIPALVERMELRWAWCMAHDMSQHPEREDALLADIAEYERLVPPDPWHPLWGRS